MAKYIALITGANRGIGLETAKQLGKSGMTILLGARDRARGEAAAATLRASDIDARCIQLDASDKTSVTAAVNEVEKSIGALDILVNNAGIMNPKDGLPSSVPVEIVREVFETNFFGLLAVTQAFLPLLKKSPAGRIVNLSSVLGSIAEHADLNSTIYQAKYTAYDSSKAAVNMLTNHLAYELRDTKIKVNAAHPGWVKTDMGGEMAPMEIVDGAKTTVQLATLPDSGPSGGFYHLGVHMRW